jgi:hypothetical protein
VFEVPVSLLSRNWPSQTWVHLWCTILYFSLIVYELPKSYGAASLKNPSSQALLI